MTPRTRRKRLGLTVGDNIIAAWPERCAGPGWSNRPVWVMVQGRDGRYRQECLQPAEQTPQIRALLDVAEASHRAFVGAVQASVDAGRPSL